MAPDDARNARKQAELRAQPWGRIQAQLTAIALKRIRYRSKSDAQDFAQSAIADAYERIDGGGWDPDRAPLMSFLVAHVISASNNERRRKRNTCEVWLDEEEEDSSEETNVHEKHLGSGAPAPDEVLHRLRFASVFKERLLARLADDALAIEVIGLMCEGLSKPGDLADATGRLIEDVREARRRVRYHAGEITKELSESAQPAHGGVRGSEVTQ